MGFLEKIFGYVMRGCYWLTHNYMLSLLLFALIFQLLLFPLGLKQQKNMVKQAMLRPQEMAIRKKYAGRNDQVTQRKMQNELLELQQKNGFSPLAGCLPMIVQMIIIFPLYWIVIRPLQYCGGLTYSTCWSLAQFAGFDMKDSGRHGLQPTSTTFQVDLARLMENGQITSDGTNLVVNGTTYTGIVDSEGVNIAEAVKNMIDKLDVPAADMFNVDLGATPFNAIGTATWFLIFIPILNLGLTYLSQFLSKKLSYQSVQQETQQGSSMKIMLLVLPLMTFFITANFASAIGVYWIFRTLLSMLQQFILAKAMPYPKFTDEDYKKAEKEFKKGITTPSASRQYPEREYRSLHHIDDDED